MRKLKFMFVITLALVMTACKSDGNGGNDNGGNNNNDVASNRCEDITVEDFDTFLGVDFDTPELELKNIMGKSTGGEYTDSKSQFMYYWKNTKRVPVTIYVNAETGAVETLFIEILGLGENFDQDVIKAGEDFNIKECHLELFGKQPKEIISIFGKADKDEIDNDSVEDGVRHLVYYSKDESIAISFKFYKSQDNRMSSLVVDWFH